MKPKKIWPRKYLDPKIYLTQKIILSKKCFWHPKNQFLLFRALMVYFWGQDRVQNCSGAYSYSWTTFIFYSSFNFDFRSWLIFEVVLYFLGANGLFLGLQKRSKNVLRSPHNHGVLSLCGWWWLVALLAITLSQPNYSYGCIVVGVVVVVGLWQ